jgi:hypothetical protein
MPTGRFYSIRGKGVKKVVRTSGLQEFRSSGVQEFRSDGVVEWWSGGVVEWWSGGVVETLLALGLSNLLWHSEVSGILNSCNS